MDLITNRDPKYFTAYLFSGMGLIHRFDDVKRAKPLLEKGMKIFPDSWELPFWLGYDYYMYLEDYDIGGRYLWRAAQKPGAPKRFLALLLSTLRKGGSYEKALWVLHEMLKGTQDERLKIVYGKKLIQLENLAFLQQSVMTYHAVKGHFPSNLADLIKEGFVERLPEDPIGMKYEWDQGKRRVVIKK